jgi:hypothetical protein
MQGVWLLEIAINALHHLTAASTMTKMPLPRIPFAQIIHTQNASINTSKLSLLQLAMCHAQQL